MLKFISVCGKVKILNIFSEKKATKKGKAEFLYILRKKAGIQTGTVTPSQNGFLSYDRTPELEPHY